MPKKNGMPNNSVCRWDLMDPISNGGNLINRIKNVLWHVAHEH
jgi:hypothetical protein